MPNIRFILYHKHPTSARVQFLRLNGTVCQFDGLPPEAKVVASTTEGEKAIGLDEAIAHIEQKLTLSAGTLKIEPEFWAEVDSPEDMINVYLAEFTTTDPPHEKMAELEGKFIAITEGRSLQPTELELLRLVYSFLMDG
ncbi:hypothetical protein IQ264_17735 [Phormidium sp. LEGE 05292]|uniref:hypothetical protein n=1 Tax=[Phormidium] sp. LEGE 05292 TaxID=767427 RepID=UPI0018815CFF|nr:hypothetical protein [Phormidium sp. LEGE 05292]MBE9227270.1 hypothetical protein [Phormidium sp. LEGE 05292]